MDKIKIVRVITRLNIGGPAIQASLLTADLDKERFVSTLFTGALSRDEGDMSYLLVEEGIEPVLVEELTREVNPLRDLRCLFKLYRYIKKEKPDIIHTHTAKAGAIGRIAAIMARVPVVIHTFHGHIFHSYFGLLRTRVFLMVERVLARFTDRIIAVSPTQKEELLKHLRIRESAKVEIVPLGFKLKRFMESDGGSSRDEVRSEFRIPPDSFVIGIVGRFAHIKNHRMFIEAAARIKKMMPAGSVKFLIVGDGELSGEIKAFSRALGIEEESIFTGWRKDIWRLYKAFDVVCLTSLNEGTPVSLIEAMASGVPVVSTDVGGVRDIVEEGSSGYLVQLEDTEGFAASVVSLLKDREKRERFGCHGRKRMAGSHSRERLIKALEKLYIAETRKKGIRKN